jgi:hypothetical protein
MEAESAEFPANKLDSRRFRFRRYFKLADLRFYSWTEAGFLMIKTAAMTLAK